MGSSRTAQSKYLRQVLDGRQSEDARTSIEHRRERHHREEVEPARSGWSALAFTAGYAAFTPELWRVTWPPKFWPDIPDKYDRKTNPRDFLQIYYTTVQAAGGDERVMTNWFPLVLKSEARAWLTNLATGSIKSWEDLCDQFVGAFQGGFKLSCHRSQERACASLRNGSAKYYTPYPTSLQKLLWSPTMWASATLA